MNKDNIEFYRDMTHIIYSLLCAAHDESNVYYAEHRVKAAACEMERLLGQINRDNTGYINSKIFPELKGNKP